MNNKFLARAACACAILCISSLSYCRQDPALFGKQRYNVLSLNAGQNYFQKGFPGYGNSQYFGADFYMPRGSIGTHWWSRYSWRLSADYFPLVLPEGVYGTTEDLFDVSISQIYFFPVNDACTSTIFAGIGFGGYFDQIRLDTPATGARSNTSFFPGASLSAGWGYKLTDSIELVAEGRTHFLYVSRDYFTVNTSVHLGLAWWFDQW
jgi:hypothetical protein